MLLKTVAILFLSFHCISSSDDDGIWDVPDEPVTPDDPFDGIFDVTEDGVASDDPVTATLSTPNNNNEDKEVCECIPYYLCDSRYTVSKRENYGEGVFHPRLSQKKECPHYLLKCCDDEDTKELEEEIATEISTEPPTTTPKPTEPPGPQGCGYRSVSSFRISQSDTSGFGEFPWIVAIYVRNLDNHINYVCGGSLIHPSVVVTAAHCMRQIKNPPKIRAGEWDPQSENEKYPHQDRDVIGVTLHSQFVPKSLHNDIALLFLKTPVDLAPHINVVCLPPPNTMVDNERCISNGWRKEAWNAGGVLKKIDLPIMPRRRCQDNLRAKLGRTFMLHSSFICAGGEEGRDTCEGDGGNPLVCPIKGMKDRYYQVGIVSWGVGCGEYQVPGVYVNIPRYRGWIDEKLRRKNIDISVYQA